jgi:hypothetical protein
MIHLLPSTAFEGILYVYIDGASLLPIVNPPRYPDPNPQSGFVLCETLKFGLYPPGGG